MSDDQPEIEPESLAYVRLTPDEAAAATDHINRKAIDPDDKCPVCGSTYNLVSPEVYRVPALTSAAHFGGLYQPLISTVCHDCGFVRFFNRLIVETQIAQHLADQMQSEHDGGGDGD